MTEEQRLSLAKGALDIAREYVGTHELTNHNDGPFIEMLQKWMDGGSGWMKGQPWCATFAMWCIYHAATELALERPLLPKIASSTSIFHFAKAHGLLLPGPEGICLGLIRGNGGDPSKDHEHTFLANARPENFPAGQHWVWGIDGNWANSVCRTQHPVSICDFVKIA